jgi:uncharacterized protein YbaR (Trm112 family)
MVKPCCFNSKLAYSGLKDIYLQIPWESVPVTAFFRCPKCGGTEIEVVPASWQCLICSQVYPVDQGIPILHCDWSAHKQKIDRAQAANRGWYEEVQPPE